MENLNKKENNLQLITCPECDGSGRKKSGLICSHCLGMGMGAFYNGKFLYWGPKLGRATIKLRHLKRTLNIVINLIAIMFGLAGLLALTWWIINDGAVEDNLGIFSFWRHKSWLILLFWFGLLADQFIFYRLSEEEAQKKKIKKTTYEERSKQFNLPDNWLELKKIKTKYRVDVSTGFSYSAFRVVEESFILANSAKNDTVLVMHLFFSLLKDNEIAALFSRLDIDAKGLVQKVKKQILQIPNQDNLTRLSNGVKEVFIEAYINASRNGQKEVRVIDLLLPMLSRDKMLEEILYDLDVDKDEIKNIIEWFRINQKLINNYKIYKKMARYKPASSMDRAYTAVATPALNHFAHDLTVAAKWGRLELCVGRDKEIENIFQQLESSRSGIILVGLVGVGKNAIVEQIAQMMVEEDVPKLLKDKRLVELDISRLVSGADPFQAEERMLVIIDEVARARNIILYIDNIENIMGISSGSEESLELSEVLAKAIEQKKIICLTTATKKNYAQFIEDKPLGNNLAKIDIEEPEINQAIQMIESKIGYFESKYNIYFSYKSIAKAVELTNKYVHDKYLPDKAISMLETIAVKIAKSKGSNSMVGENDVASVISEMTKIPVNKISQSEGQELLNLEQKIHERMIDQEEAVKMVADSLRRARAELRESKRPIASFLFMGPTGVGKTELAKTIAEVYFGREDYMIRIDMSEYQHPDSVKKMIGSPQNLGLLTEAVRKTPFALILLDEFEKAHPDILNLFLQVMDDGRLTDGQGRTVDFTNCIIISTSNIGATYIQSQIMAGKKIEEIKQTLINEKLNQSLRPELINRFDGIIVFKPLSINDVEKITKLILNKTEKMLEAKGVGLWVDEAGIKLLAKQGFDPKFGARPLRRLIQDKIENEIANKILANEVKRRDVIVINSEAKISIEKGRQL